MGAYNYSFGKWGKILKNSAEVAGPVLMALKESEKGLNPDTLLEASRPEDAPLHNEFEWDDTVAAEKFRKEQARYIIRHLVVIHKDTNGAEQIVKDRAFVFTGKKKTGYVPLGEALSNETWRANLLKAAYKDMEFFTAKYHRLNELSDVIDAMRRILSQRDAG